MRKTILALTLLLAISAGAHERFSYVYSRGKRSVIRIGNSFDHYKKIAKRFSGDYIWLYHNGRGYVIRDAGVLAAVQTAFAPVDALEPKMREAEAKLRPVEQKYEELEERVDKINDRGDEDSVLERRLRELERELEVVERAAEAVEDEIDRREEIAEKKLEQLALRAIAEGKAERVD